MTNYVAYYRVSTQRQGQSGLGLEAQERATKGFLQASDDLVHSFTEIESGRKDDRPVLALALQYCKDNNATLLIAKIDRLARDVHFISGLLKANVPIVFADMPTADRMMIHVGAAFAEREAEMISERTKASLQSYKDRGGKLGTHNPKVMAGRWATGQASANSLMVHIKTIPDYQSKSLQTIANILNDKGIKTIRGSSWNKMQVKRAIERHTMA